MKEVHLRDYYKTLRKRRGLIFFFAVITFSLVALVTFRTEPLYEGQTKVMIEQVETTEFTNRSYGVRDPSFMSTQLQVIKSRAVARRVVDLLGIDLNDENMRWLAGEKKKEGFVSRARSVLGSVLKKEQVAPLEAVETLSREDRMAAAIAREIRVRPIPDTRLVTISFLSPNPRFSALVADTTAKAFIEETLDMKMESVRRTLDWMTKQADVEREKLERAEISLQDYMRQNEIVTLHDRVAVTPEELSEISTQLMRAENRRKELEALNIQVRSVMNGAQAPESISAIASDPSLQTLRTQIVAAEKSVMELSGRYGARHPVMEKTVADLQMLERKRKQEITRIVDSIRNEYELAVTNERNLRQKMESLKGEALRLNDKFVQYGALRREVETNRQIYEALMLRIKEQSATQEKQPVDLWVVEGAQVPASPAKPKTMLNLLIGVCLGVFGGVGLAFFAEYLDNSIKNPEDAEEHLQTPILGVITKGKSKVMEEVVLKEPRSTFAENYKGLRTSLLLSSAGAVPRKILLTSSVSGEGKTTTAINLAMTLAQSDKRVVLIDGDMRKPRLHKVFKMKNGDGLSNYLAGSGGAEILKKGPHPNLTVVTSGPIPPNPSELFLSDRMQNFLDSLLDSFDFVICDTPPVMAVEDARILSRLCDGTILVTRAHQTTYEIAARSVKALREVKTPLLGIVINGLDLRKSGGSHYYYYQNYREEIAAAAARG
jgi:polysaccharide biosynthesis transport protein